MNNKGFTLAETMGVLIILAIISSIVFVSVDRSIKNSRYETCLAQEKNIIEGAKMWSIDNPKSLPTSGSTTVSVSTLDSGGYIETGLVNPMTNKVYSTGTTVKITTTTGKDFDYQVTYVNNEQCAK